MSGGVNRPLFNRSNIAAPVRGRTSDQADVSRVRFGAGADPRTPRGGGATEQQGPRVEPPCIEPSSGMYCPPVLVSITHPLAVGADPATSSSRGSPFGPGRIEIYYTVQHASTAEKLASQKGYAESRQRLKYTGPFTLKAPGRVKITAVAIWVSNQQAQESSLATALYALDPTSPPPPSVTTGSFFHTAPVPIPEVIADQMSRAAVGSPQPQAPQPAYRPLGSPNERPTNQMVSQFTEFPSPMTAPDLPKPLQELHMLRFSEFPKQVRCYEPFDICLYLVDPYGFPVAAPRGLQTPVQLALSGDVIVTGSRSGSEQATSMQLKHNSSFSSPVIVAHAEGVIREQGSVPLRWNSVHNLVCSEGGPLHGASVSRSGESNANKWNSVGISSNCVGLTAPASGFTWKVTNSCRAIVGLYDETRNGSVDVDPLDETTWRVMAYSFHFSSDLSDPTMLPAYRIYEHGVLVKQVDTKDFTPGDTFAMKLRSNGRLAYLVNNEVVHVSSLLFSQAAAFGRLSVQVRIASQIDSPALDEMALLEQETPCIFKLSGVVWHPINAIEDGEGVWERLGVLRAWVVGADFVPAVTKVPLVIASIPRWGFAGATLATMFALGALGLQGNQVANALKESQARIPQLSLLRAGSSDLHRFAREDQSRRNHINHERSHGGHLTEGDAEYDPNDYGRDDVREYPLLSPKVARYPSSPLNRRRNGQPQESLTSPPKAQPSFGSPQQGVQPEEETSPEPKASHRRPAVNPKPTIVAANDDVRSPINLSARQERQLSASPTMPLRLEGQGSPAAATNMVGVGKLETGKQLPWDRVGDSSQRREATVEQMKLATTSSILRPRDSSPVGRGQPTNNVTATRQRATITDLLMQPTSRFASSPTVSNSKVLPKLSYGGYQGFPAIPPTAQPVDPPPRAAEYGSASPVRGYLPVGEDRAAQRQEADYSYSRGSPLSRTLTGGGSDFFDPTSPLHDEATGKRAQLQEYIGQL